MSCYVGLTESWLNDTYDGNKHISSANIEVNDGLILKLDARRKISYPSTGNIWYDISGNNNHCTLYNSPTFSNGYFMFDGISSWCSIPVIPNVVSIGVWWQLLSTSISHPLRSFLNGTTSSTFLYGRSGYVQVINEVAPLYIDTQKYVNTVANDSMTVAVGNNVWQYIHINFNTPGNHRIDIMKYYLGNVAKINVYNRVLSDSEILRNVSWNSGKYGS